MAPGNSCRTHTRNKQGELTVKDLLFELGILTLIGAGVFLFMLGWKQAVSDELTQEKIYTLDEDGRYFMRFSWTPEFDSTYGLNTKEIGVVKAQIGIWLN